jgi:hypothetical protein
MDQQGTFYYADSTVKDPAYFLCPPPADAHKRDPGRVPEQHHVADVRDYMESLSIDQQGLAFVRQQSATADFYDDEEVRNTYYPEVQDLVMAQTGAKEVFVFDHNVRSKELAGSDQTAQRAAVQNPVKSVHNDYTEVSGPQRVRDFLPERAEELVNRRFAMINVWRPIVGPVLQTPFAVIDAGSISKEDFIPIDLVYSDRVGQIYMVQNNPKHRWLYLSEMQHEEVMLLKCFDSDLSVPGRFTAHSAFELPVALDDEPLPSRQSIEVRTLVFY